LFVWHANQQSTRANFEFIARTELRPRLAWQAGEQYGYPARQLCEGHISVRVDIDDRMV
jgi:hypothetical protein